MNIKLSKSILTSSLTGLLLSGCVANSSLPTINNRDSTTSQTQTGAIIGGLLGALIGGTTGNKKGKRVVIGAATGTAIGAVIGYSLDQQAKEIAQTLHTDVDNTPKAEENSNKELIVSNTDKFVKIMFRDPMMFATNASQPTSSATAEIRQIIPSLKNEKYSNMIIQTVGHTDSRGSYSRNKQLSEARASSVANIIKDSGINNLIYAKGCSFSKPIVQNTSTANMALNRRVEIYLYPNKESVVDPCMNN